jgi:hypothetical protein
MMMVAIGRMHADDELEGRPEVDDQRFTIYIRPD